MMAVKQLSAGLPLSALVPDFALPQLDGRAGSVVVSGLALDSRKVQPGDAFLAYPGDRSDGRDYLREAIARGAAAVLVEAGRSTGDLEIPCVAIPDLRMHLSAIAGRFHADPSRVMRVVGVTGTNGKTTTSQLLGQILRAAGQPCGVLGTLGASVDAPGAGGGLTTPDAVAVQAQLAQWKRAGIGHVAMEVSSHGLVQGRVEALRFSGAVFTNLSRDHLDYHGDMARYAAAKRRLFHWPELGFAVVNGDDAMGRELAAELAGQPGLLRYSLEDSGADLCAVDRQMTLEGMRARVLSPWGEIPLETSLLGDFNLANLLAAVAAAGSLGLDADAIARAVAQCRPVPGRMERIAGAGVSAVVDYAHTPDGLAQALRALREHCPGRLWCVFGCGGDRDRGKRPEMGRIAEVMADRVVVTSDNPRGESPLSIIDEIVGGMSQPPLVEADRAKAIALAIAAAEPGDLVLIAGKGHETHQEITGRRYPFSDREQVITALAHRGGR
ncbi:MAG: UDP-N-acetylmuramoyl-L-alanyl-D-glutamate--2,6-diaminopimelate ligase [Spongiibacteraceae bacterium]|jgi:UDP-N-acetylmuramoyl-L-alanyl-D-glutamate--2,6-diaminopimelate ligase|nr:UDP-N-acetylmuramoyl-L-alanyl-D-glutamate--2,6-diaminopimelate ligase [Spongiibacteraceae bacterium]